MNDTAYFAKAGASLVPITLADASDLKLRRNVLKPREGHLNLYNCHGRVIANVDAQGRVWLGQARDRQAQDAPLYAPAVKSCEETGQKIVVANTGGCGL